VVFVALAVALLLMVAAGAGAAKGVSAAGDSQFGGLGGSQPAGLGVPAWASDVVLAFLAAGAVVLAYRFRFAPLARWRGRRKWEGQEERQPWWLRLVTYASSALVALGFFVLLVWLLRLIGNPARHPSQPGLAPLAPPRAAVTPAYVDWAALGVGAGVALGAIAIMVWVAHLRTKEVPKPWPKRDEQVEQRRRAVGAVGAVDDSLTVLQAEPDPRRAIIAAYASMDRWMAQAGFGRQPWEAPFEHLDRVLGGLGATAAVAATLARLFERAKFGHHPCGQDMKQAALAALVELRDALAQRSALARGAVS
jgi:hypothetical protein